MIDIKEAPGVIGLNLRPYVTINDVVTLFRCSKSKASFVIKDVNKKVEDEGGIAFPAGKANKYIFSQMTQIPMEQVDEVITQTDKIGYDKWKESHKKKGGT